MLNNENAIAFSDGMMYYITCASEMECLLM